MGPVPTPPCSRMPDQTRVPMFMMEKEERQEGNSGDEVERSQQERGKPSREREEKNPISRKRQRQDGTHKIEK